MNITEILPMRNALRKSTNTNTKAFLVFSDSHGHFNNKVNRVISLANEWGSSYVDAIINCGDSVDSYFAATGTAAIDDYFTQLGNSEVDVLTAIGNHDAWRGYYHKWIDESELNSIFGSQVATYASVFGSTAPTQPSTNSCYYYKDYGNVRVIVLNAVHVVPNSNTEVGGEHPSAALDVYWDSTQKTWLQTVLADAKTNSKHVLMVNHYFFDTDKMSPWDYTNIKAFKTGTEGNPWLSELGFSANVIEVYGQAWLPDEVLGCVKSFMDSGGILVGWLAGHTHYDMWWGVSDEYQETYGKQMMFTTGSLRYQNDVETDSTNYLFNYVTVDTYRKVMTVMRIGAGCDFYGRERRILVWDYDNKVVLRYK